MIEKFYPSKKPQVVYQLTTGIKTEYDRAKERGLDLMEYRRRVGLVAKAWQTCTFNVGNILWPSIQADAVEHGMVKIVGIVKHYDDYGDVQWNENPFILSVSPMKDLNTTINCTVGWVTKEAPSLIQQEC